MWLGWILGSAFLLSVYDLCKKASVRDNVVFPCLLGSTLTGWCTVTAFLLCRGELSAAVAVPAKTAALLLVKSCLVGGSWTATYMALRTLPITSAAPIRATGPLWTLLGAVLLFGEMPTAVQAAGMALALTGCWLFSLSAKHEGVSFWHSKAIALAFVGTFLGSCSALYDKRLLQQMHIPTGTVLWWFMGGMCVIYAVAVMRGLRRVRRFRGLRGLRGLGELRGETEGMEKFEWRWSIPLVGVLLAASDACYFSAISTPDAKISVLSLIRRSSVIFTFLVGGAVFREKNLKRKAFALLFILLGVLLLCLKR